MSDPMNNAQPSGERDPFTWMSPNANAAPSESIALASANTPAPPAPAGTPAEGNEDLQRA